MYRPYFNEAIDDRVSSFIIAGTGIGIVYDDNANTLTISASGTPGSGDVSSNTSSSVDSEIVLFSGIGGKTIKRGTTTGILKGTSGVISAATADIDYVTPNLAIVYAIALG